MRRPNERWSFALCPLVAEPYSMNADAQDAGRPRTAAALVIGNELLSGKVDEANLPVLARALRGLGVLLRRVVMVQDDARTIAREVQVLSAAHDWLFTSGGVGPTHDDVTIEAVAAAFGVAVVPSPQMEAMLREHYGARCTDGHLRMALVPEGAVARDARARSSGRRCASGTPG